MKLAASVQESRRILLIASRIAATEGATERWISDTAKNGALFWDWCIEQAKRTADYHILCNCGALLGISYAQLKGPQENTRVRTETITHPEPLCPAWHNFESDILSYREYV